MKHWTLRKRLGLGFGLLCLALLVLGGLTVVRLHGVANQASEVSTLYTQQGQLADDMLASASVVAISARGYDLLSTEEQWKVVEADRAKAAEALEHAEAFGGANPKLTQLKAGLKSARSSFDAYRRALADFHDSANTFSTSWNDLVPAGGRLFDALFTVVNALESAGAKSAAEGAATAVQQDVVQLKLLTEALRDSADMRLACWRVVATQDPQPATVANAKAAAGIAKLRQLRESTSVKELAVPLEQAITSLEVYEKGTLKLQAAMEKKLQSRKARSDAYFAFADTVKSLQVDTGAMLNSGATATAGRLQSLIFWVAVGSAIAVALGMAVAIVISRQTNRVLSRVAEALSGNSEHTAAASDQVASASQSLAQGASEQASSLEEASASIEELSSMTKRNVESAQRAKALSDQTRAAAEAGTSDMHQMEQAMDAIKASSDGISKIIKAIDEIAFQTNILALNAAVEAARAGEAGMGFAVVADEVRSLAQRSAQSSRESAAKIEEAIQNSANGVRISQSVARSLADIVEKAREVDALVGEIVSASAEQSQGLHQVNITVGQMDKVTQANAGSAEETAASAEELKAQAAIMRESVQDLVRLVGAANATSVAAPAFELPPPDSASPGLLHAPSIRRPILMDPAAGAPRSNGGIHPTNGVTIGGNGSTGHNGHGPLDSGADSFEPVTRIPGRN